MNRYYIASLLSLSIAFVACEKRDPELFDEESNGAYFDYEYAADFDKTLNFSEYIVGAPDTVIVPLKVKLLGYLMEEGRTLAVKTKEVEGYELADVTIDEVVFANNEYEKDIEVKVKRPAIEDIHYAVCIYLDGSGDIGTAIKGKEEITLFVTEMYDKPVVWYNLVDTYLGTWSKEKHIFLAKHTGDNHFYTTLHDEKTGGQNLNAIIELNASAVNALLASEPALTDSVAVDIPILKESDFPDYDEPYFWKYYKGYLGAYSVNKFCHFTTILGGSNTKDVAALYAGEDGGKKMKDYHRPLVSNMLEAYYGYARQGLSIAEYDSLSRVDIKSGLNYSVRIPFWWEDPDGLGTAAIVKKYFGEYEDEKYQFMLKTMSKEEGEADFIAASILPFVYDLETGAYGWDLTPLGTNQRSGEERLKECYRVIKAANDKRAKPMRYDIPDVDLD